MKLNVCVCWTCLLESEYAFSLQSKPTTNTISIKNRHCSFSKTILYIVDVKDNMLEQRFPRKMHYFCNNGGTSQKHN